MARKKMIVRRVEAAVAEGEALSSPSLSIPSPPLTAPSSSHPPRTSVAPPTAAALAQTLTAHLLPSTTTDATSTATTSTPDTTAPGTAIPAILAALRASHPLVTQNPLQNPQPRLNAAGDFLNPLYGSSTKPPFDLNKPGAGMDSPAPDVAIAGHSDSPSDSSGSPSPGSPVEDRGIDKGKKPIQSESDHEYNPSPETGTKRKRVSSTAAKSRKRSSRRTRSSPPTRPRTRSAFQSPPMSRYNALPASKLLMERGFDPQLVNSIPHIKHHLMAFKWENVIPHPGKANASLL